jgi:hypothetical protein
MNDDAEGLAIDLERSAGTSIMAAGVADPLDRPGDIFATHRYLELATDGSSTTLGADKLGAHAAARIVLRAASLGVEGGDHTLDFGDGGRSVRRLADDIAVGGKELSSIVGSGEDSVGDLGELSGLVVDDRNSRSSGIGNGRGSGSGNGHQSTDDEELEDEGHLDVDVEAHLEDRKGNRSS